MARSESAGVTYARLGFADPAKAERLVGDPALAGLIDPLDDSFDDGLIQALGDVADPDLALLTLVRLMEALSMLAAGASITRVTYDVGYDSPSGFAAMFRRAFGVPPSQYLKQ